MPIAIHHETANHYRLEIRGLLRKAEFDQCVKSMAGQISRFGPVRLLVLLEGFTGWDAQDNWSDLSFYIAHGESIERIAIVGPERWRSETMMFAIADLRRAPVEFFPENAAAAARAWLAM